MANAQAIATSFKTDSMAGIHAFTTTVVRGTTAADTFKGALYLTTATIGAATTAYSATNEVTGAGYTAGGVTLTWIAPAATGTTAFTTPSAPLAWTGLTAGPFDCVLIYNSTQSNKAFASYTFGSQTISASNFSLTMPTNDSANALFRIA
jgi:hypothetical protein